MIKVMIVDNHPIFRAGLKAVFDGNPNLEIVAEAENGQLALAQLETVNIDVMLLDIRMPVLDGIETLAQVKQRFPQVKVCMLTTCENINVFHHVMALHADGFLLKRASAEMVFQAIKDVMAGEVTVSPELLRSMINYRDAERNLSAADLDVLTRVARGDRNSEIAKDLHFSERTIKSHLTNIYTKLGVNSRAGAVAKAMQLELIRLQ